jgi:SulP family sulfate permease
MLTVWLIFGVIVGVDVLVGVGVGLLLASLTFIVRFSQISVVGSDMPLSRLASTVERSATEQQFLQEKTQGMQVINLRGYIFFGTANAFFESVKTTQEGGRAPASAATFAIFNFNRVIGIDSTGAQVFVKLITFLNARNVTPVFCGMNVRVAHIFALAEVFAEGDVLVVADLDRALKAVEVRLLASREAPAYPATIRGVLRDYLDDPEKIEQLASMMDRIALRKGEVLFREGDLEESVYFIEHGTVEVRLEQPDGDGHRLREFRDGSVLGEMALVTDVHRRSATACAVEDSIVFRLEPSKFDRLGDRAVEYRSILHELIARVLASRLAFMNQRTRLEI